MVVDWGIFYKSCVSNSVLLGYTVGQQQVQLLRHCSPNGLNEPSANGSNAPSQERMRPGRVEQAADLRAEGCWRWKFEAVSGCVEESAEDAHNDCMM